MTAPTDSTSATAATDTAAEPDAAPASPPEPSARRRAIGYVVVALVVLATAATRALVESAREVSAAELSLAAGDTSDGVRKLRRAAHWYVPGSPFVARAYDRLERVATEAEAQGRSEQALSAWRAIRSSALATRWLLVPERSRLERANRHIAALMAELPPPPEDRTKDRARLREEHLSLLNEDKAPDPAWLVVLAIGLGAWLIGLFRALRDGWDEDDRVQKRPLAISLALSLGGLALLLYAVARA